MDKDAAGVLRDQLRQEVPVRTATLQKSIKTAKAIKGYQTLIGNVSAPYARPLMAHQKSTTGTNFVEVALDKTQQARLQSYRRNMAVLIRRKGLNR